MQAAENKTEVCVGIKHWKHMERFGRGKEVLRRHAEPELSEGEQGRREAWCISIVSQ